MSDKPADQAAGQQGDYLNLKVKSQVTLFLP